MKLQKQIASDLRKFYFGGNWTAVSMKESIEDVDWRITTQEVYGLNSIATLVYHVNYYIAANIKVLEGGPLEAKDQYSFSHPPIASKADWNSFTDQIYEQAEHFATLIEKMPENNLWEDFTDPKYGTYYRNFQGIIEHCHYHLGQIVLLKKIIRQQDKEV
jgi:hypothetical protein